MEFSLRCTAAALAGLLCIACASSVAKGKSPRAQYPAVLHGAWLGEGRDYCKRADSLDSDSRFEITAGKRTGYEDWNEPVSVVQISKDPQAWKIVSTLHINEDAMRIEEVFLISGQDNGALTIVNRQQAMTYYRCP